eukprot:jgi/Mesvir1/7105/Mv09210-RA.1
MRNGGTRDTVGMDKRVPPPSYEGKTLVELFGEDSNIIEWSELKHIRYVGEGSFSTVGLYRYKGEDVCVKVLNEVAQAQPELVDTFINEIKLLKRLKHPCIVGYRGCGKHDGAFFLVMEHLEGGSLASLVGQHICPPTKAFAFAKEIAAAIEYMHGLKPKVMHRDLKPENVLLTLDDHVKLVDMGLCYQYHHYLEGSAHGQKLALKKLQEANAAANGGAHATANGGMNISANATANMGGGAKGQVHSVLAVNGGSMHSGSLFGVTGLAGTYRYMAPEIIANKKYNEKVDVFSFGILFYELIAEQRAYQERYLGSMEVAKGAAANLFRPKVNRQWPPILKVFLKSCWDDDPKKACPSHVKYLPSAYQMRNPVGLPTRPTHVGMILKESLPMIPAFAVPG